MRRLEEVGSLPIYRTSEGSWQSQLMLRLVIGCDWGWWMAQGLQETHAWHASNGLQQQTGAPMAEKGLEGEREY